MKIFIVVPSAESLPDPCAESDLTHTVCILNVHPCSHVLLVRVACMLQFMWRTVSARVFTGLCSYSVHTDTQSYLPSATCCVTVCCVCCKVEGLSLALEEKSIKKTLIRWCDVFPVIAISGVIALH